VQLGPDAAGSSFPAALLLLCAVHTQANVAIAAAAVASTVCRLACSLMCSWGQMLPAAASLQRCFCFVLFTPRLTSISLLLLLLWFQVFAGWPAI
jgi:hypothetical protein